MRPGSAVFRWSQLIFGRLTSPESLRRLVACSRVISLGAWREIEVSLNYHRLNETQALASYLIDKFVDDTYDAAVAMECGSIFAHGLIALRLPCSSSAVGAIPSDALQYFTEPANAELVRVLHRITANPQVGICMNAELINL